jgi:hypothetical protein
VEEVRASNVLTILLFFAICSSVGFARSLVESFHEVTAIRGRVVGRDLGPVQSLSLRQSSDAKGADLTLYEYQAVEHLEDLKLVAKVKSDDSGHFDFGSIAEGRYILRIVAKGSGEDRFEVKVTPKAKPTESILVDVSPVMPDCSGGHKSIVKVKG